MTDWFPPDENGIRWTVRLEEVIRKGKRYWACQRCKDKLTR